ncbi:hypothetical protein BC834DRAFT_782735, partial [Gloeopeniophorella convolvens]
FIDLTHPLDADVPVYPGDPPFSSEPVCSVPKDGYAVHALSASSHAGTHVDAPSHFFADGATIDQLPPSTFVLPAVVIDVSHKRARECISWAADVAPHTARIRPGTAVLFHTGWSRHWRDAAGRYFDHPWLAADVAVRLLALGVRVIGTDTMSPDQMPGAGMGEGEGEPDYGVHRAVLGAGGLIVENLANLGALAAAQRAAPAADAVLSVLPLRIARCDGSPVRAVA